MAIVENIKRALKEKRKEDKALKLELSKIRKEARKEALEERRQQEIRIAREKEKLRAENQMKLYQQRLNRGGFLTQVGKYLSQPKKKKVYRTPKMKMSKPKKDDFDWILKS